MSITSSESWSLPTEMPVSFHDVLNEVCFLRRTGQHLSNDPVCKKAAAELMTYVDMPPFLNPPSVFNTSTDEWRLAIFHTETRTIDHGIAADNSASYAYLAPEARVPMLTEQPDIVTMTPVLIDFFHIPLANLALTLHCLDSRNSLTINVINSNRTSHTEAHALTKYGQNILTTMKTPHVMISKVNNTQCELIELSRAVTFSPMVRALHCETREGSTYITVPIYYTSTSDAPHETLCSASPWGGEIERI